MDSEHRLFRQEVVDARRGQWLGSINLAVPLSRWVLTLLAATLATGIIAFLVFGHYTKRQRVTGKLVPSAGMLAVTAVNAGTVTEVFVHTGQSVQAGQQLLEVSAERDSATLGSTRAEISTQLRTQRKRLKQNLATQKQQNHAKEQAVNAKLRSLRAQMQQIDVQLKLQTQQAADAEGLLKRIRPLREKGYVSALQVQQQKAAVLDARTQLKSLTRQRLQVHQQLTSTRQDLVRLPLQLATKDNIIEGKIADITSQLAQNEARRAMVLRAPRAGVVSTLLVKQGKHVAAGQSLLSILPDGSSLQAQLLVPSRAVGFVAPGSRVVLRYQAYPYQKFGQQYGHVASISRSALGPGEIVALTGKRTKQPLYRVKVKLDRQAIRAYGKAHALKPGMALSADIMMERRSLLEWAFEPLYGLKGSVLAGEGGSHG
ncbi:MAG TPA: HlyD family efflux transporter periplasmic adaptor subunit [Oleiagrimonas sp.]|nr:HlyD family efflux transporter periplasmic adaptor subunit [Oleiagrimonas sp.]